MRESKTFSTKAEALAWAAMRETEIGTEKSTGIQRGRTADDAFRRYDREVSIHKRGHRWAAIQLSAIGKRIIDGTVLSEMKLAEVTPDILGEWRDQRLKLDKVSGSTVNRKLNLISHVFSSAAKEWKWISASPTTDVRQPKKSAPRDRLYAEDEIDRICMALGVETDLSGSAEMINQRVPVAFLFAIETAMRVGEICGLMPSDVNGRVARLQRTKNGLKRDVPLSSRAGQAGHDRRRDVP